MLGVSRREKCLQDPFLTPSQKLMIRLRLVAGAKGGATTGAALPMGSPLAFCSPRTTPTTPAAAPPLRFGGLFASPPAYKELGWHGLGHRPLWWVLLGAGHRGVCLLAKGKIQKVFAYDLKKERETETLEVLFRISCSGERVGIWNPNFPASEGSHGSESCPHRLLPLAGQRQRFLRWT